MQVWQDVLDVERFEVSIMRLVKVNQDSHEFAFCKLAAALALDLAAVQQRLFPAGSKCLPKIIDTAKEFE
jgi:hypothetical protein